MSALAAEYVIRNSHPFQGLSAEGPARSVLGDAKRAIEQVTQQSDAMRDARRLLASWLQRCLRQGAYRDHPRAVAALPAEAIAQRLRQATDLPDGAPDVGNMQAELMAQFAQIDKLVTQFAAACKSQPETLCLYDELVERGLAALQQLADLEVALSAHKAGLDLLTGLPGRRALQQRLLSEHARLRRHAQPCTLVLIDLNRLKPVNDRYGHMVGDAYLAAFADVLRGALRPYDTAFRYGGDEFILCLPQAGVEQATAVIGRLRERLAGQALLCIQGRFLHARFSAGVAALEVGKTIAQSLEEADARLYEAKACASAAPGPACDDGPCDA
nr:GGDEF domain-containing protein [Thiomonas sp.]